MAKPKKRGPKVLQTPSPRDSEVLEAVRWGYTLADIARVHGISKQRVHQIKKRWPKLCVEQRPPIMKGVI